MAAKRRIKPSRVILAMAIIIGTLTAADGFRRSLSGTEPYNIKVSGSFRSSGQTTQAATENSMILGNEVQSSTTFEGVQYLGFSEITIDPEKLYEGTLALYDQEHPAKSANKADTVDLASYRNEFYTLIDSSVILNEDAAMSLNSLMEDYNKATGLNDFIVYGTDKTYTGEGSFCPEYFPESASGNTVDLAINGYAAVIAYDGYDEESWVVENCWKYGYIVRYPEGKTEITGHSFCPWHLRYVGAVHAAAMHEKNLCLEEYIGFLKGFDVDDPFEYSANGVGYTIYSVTADSEETSVRVPVSGNYDVSGNSSDGYIITALSK